MKLRHGLLLLAIIHITGCGMFGDKGMFRNRSYDYLEAEETQPLVVPEGLDSKALGQLYYLPPVAETAILDNSHEVPRPLPLSENVFKEQVKIQKLGKDEWILINKSPSEVWPRLRSVLNRSSIPAVRADAQEGVLETAWLSFKDDNANSHRFRFKLESGVQPNSTEIRILHNQVVKGEEPNAVWPKNSNSDAREQQMIKLVANAIAGDVTTGTVSMLAQTIGGKAKVDLITPKVADPYLEIRLNYDRSWASVNYSLSRGGFSIADQNRSAGVMYVNYQPEGKEKKPGFFKRLFSFGKKKKRKHEYDYQVLIAKGDEGVEVRIVDSNGNGLERDKAVQLLQVIRGNLS